MNVKSRIFGSKLSKIIVVFWLSFVIVLSVIMPVFAQIERVERVQTLYGNIYGEDDIKDYTLANLRQGDKLYVHVQATSGNLDPFTGLLSTTQLRGERKRDFDEEVKLAIENNRDPLLVVSEFADQNFLVWDDDSGGGFSAAFEYAIPEDGDYHLVVISSPFTDSFGDYQLTVGLNDPQALSGEAINKGETFVIPTSIADTRRAAVQEVTATIGGENLENRYRLLPFLQDDTLYVYVETLEGDLIPQVILRAFGTKPIRSANIEGSEQQASFDYTFPAETREYLIEVIPKDGTSGTYRLLVGRNEPTVLVGEANPYGERLLLEPLEVSIGIKLQQIANIDQKAENYEAVAATLFSWNDPALAFRPDQCKCESKLFLAEDFASFAADEGIQYPVFTYLNQQNNRWIQNEYVVVYPNGDAIYFERFTTTFQAPDFDFRQFPFDTQTFFIRVDSLLSTENANYIISDFTEVGSQLGEEEWVVIDHETEVITEPSSTGNETSSFVFRFWAERHLSFYIFRIFVPLILILSVTWITFFMADYGKRVDATTANLLLFIAFNFTIAGELPRLGYLTYMDALLAGAFFISVLVVIYNVYLKRQETLERQTWAQKIDKYMIWVYPLGYALAFIGITWYFFWM
jgi:hypothetical protein